MQIRALRTDDLPAVVSLYRAHLARPQLATHDELVEAFARIFLSAPLHDPAIPSLIAVDAEGDVIGFLGSQVHRMVFDDRPVRLGCSSALVVAPQARNAAIGAFLLKRYLSGPQDLTITDTAAQPTEYLWKRLGGSTLPLSSIVWVCPIRPLEAVAGLGLWRFGRHRWLRLLRPLCRPIDLALTRTAKREPTQDADDLTDEPLSSQSMIDHLLLGRDACRLRPAYDPESLDQLMAEIGRSRSKGMLVRRLVRDRDGEAAGWFIAFLLPNGVYEIAHVAAAPGRELAMIRHLIADATARGASAVRGRLEPWIIEALPRRAIMFSRVRFLIHSPDPTIVRAAQTSDMLVTGLEGDMWMPT